MKYFYEEWNKSIFEKNYDKKMCDYLEKELGIVIDLDEVDKIINDDDETQTIDNLVNFTIELCKSYVLHDYLIQLGYQKCSSGILYQKMFEQNLQQDCYAVYKGSFLKEEYIQIIKEHKFSYFYYGFQVYLCKDESRLFKNLVCNHMEYKEGESYDYANLVNKHRRLVKNCFDGLLHLFKGSYKIKNENDLPLPRPLKIDIEVLFNLILLNATVPCNETTYGKPMYTVEKMMKCLDSMQKITLNKNTLHERKEDQGLIFCNNYLLERIFNFDIVAHVINVYDENIEENTDNMKEIEKYKEDMREKIKEIGILFMDLPNVFSRKKLMQDIMVNNGSLEQKKDYLNFLIYVTFPVLNLVFNFIMRYYALKKELKKEKSMFNNLLNNYINKLLLDPSYNIYRNIDIEEDGETIIKITTDDIAKLQQTRKKNEQNKKKQKRLFSEQNDICHTLMKHVWEEVLTEKNLKRINLNSFSSIFDDDRSKQIKIHRQLNLARLIYEDRMEEIEQEKPKKMIRVKDI